VELDGFSLACRENFLGLAYTFSLLVWLIYFC